MKKLRLTESELISLIKRVIKEENTVPMPGEQKENKKKGGDQDPEKKNNTDM